MSFLRNFSFLVNLFIFNRGERSFVETHMSYWPLRMKINCSPMNCAKTKKNVLCARDYAEKLIIKKCLLISLALSRNVKRNRKDFGQSETFSVEVFVVGIELGRARRDFVSLSGVPACFTIVLEMFSGLQLPNLFESEVFPKLPCNEAKRLFR